MRLWLCKSKYAFSTHTYRLRKALSYSTILNSEPRSMVSCTLVTLLNTHQRQPQAKHDYPLTTQRDSIRQFAKLLTEDAVWYVANRKTISTQGNRENFVLLHIYFLANALHLKDGSGSIAKLQLCHTVQVNAWLGGNFDSKSRNAIEVRLHFVCICDGWARYTRWRMNTRALLNVTIFIQWNWDTTKIFSGIVD